MMLSLLCQEQDQEMSIFDGVPDLTDSSNYGQLEWKNNARPSVGHALLDEIAYRCCSKKNDEMVMFSFDWRERSTLSLLD